MLITGGAFLIEDRQGWPDDPFRSCIDRFFVGLAEPTAIAAPKYPDVWTISGRHHQNDGRMALVTVVGTGEVDRAGAVALRVIPLSMSHYRAVHHDYDGSSSSSSALSRSPTPLVDS